MVQVKKGDKVAWHAASGKATGEVMEKITGTRRIDGKTIEGSNAHPMYRIRNKNGGMTFTDGDSLKKENG